MIKLIIVVDQPDLRKGLRMRLAAEEDLDVTGEAVDCESAMDLLHTSSPEVVLIDAEMIHTDGVALARNIHMFYPNTKVIILSLHDDESIRQRTKEAGAAGFVAKSLPADTLLKSIRQVAKD